MKNYKIKSRGGKRKAQKGRETVCCLDCACLIASEPPIPATAGNETRGDNGGGGLAEKRQVRVSRVFLSLGCLNGEHLKASPKKGHERTLRSDARYLSFNLTLVIASRLCLGPGPLPCLIFSPLSLSGGQSLPLLTYLHPARRRWRYPLNSPI